MTAAIRERIAHVNGVDLQVLEAGEPGAPLIVLSHGFPEGAWSWRHQLPVLADAGYHVIAPYQRGYGASSNPHDVAFYGIEALCDDLCALITEAGHEQAVVVGHDWGAIIVWEMAKLRPSRIKAVVGVSVPFVQWPAPPTQLMKMVYGDRFFYILYFQPVGPAETELGADPRRTMMRMLYGASGEGFNGPPPELPPMEGTGLLSLGEDPPPPPYSGPEGVWLTEADLEHYVADFTHSGFFGPVSYYRNLDANYEVTKSFDGSVVTMPSYFIAGTKDLVLVMDPTGVERMQATLPNFHGATLIEAAGHWVQQEAPAAFNEALLGFLATL